MADVVFEITEVKAKLQEFFPPTDDNSPWLLRLAIIRDDVHFEFSNTHRKLEGQDDWLLTYNLRRLTASLMEAKHVLVHNVQGYLKAGEKTDATLANLAVQVRNVIKDVEAACELLKPIRDSIGGHVEIKDALKVLSNHPLLEGSVTVLGHSESNSYREVSKYSVLFTIPDADTDEKVHSSFDKLRETLETAATGVVHVADGVLTYYWIKLGLVKATEGRDIGLRDKKDRNKYNPI